MLLGVCKDDGALGQPEESREYTVQDTSQHEVPFVTVLDVTVQCGGIHWKASHARHEGPLQAEAGDDPASEDADHELQDEDDRVGSVDIYTVLACYHDSNKKWKVEHTVWRGGSASTEAIDRCP